MLCVACMPAPHGECAVFPSVTTLDTCCCDVSTCVAQMLVSVRQPHSGTTAFAWCGQQESDHEGSKKMLSPNALTSTAAQDLAVAIPH